jgi:uncharacterized protein (DUF2252 family)
LIGIGDVPERIRRFNKGREPERLALKYREMCKSPFSFFRGTAHLFWEDLGARRSALPGSPLVWACGDLHLENFGSFQGNNGLSYFDLNDFDEAALAPATWEVSRFVASVYVAAPVLNLTRPEANELVKSFLDAYQTALGDGKARWIERATASGMVRTLLQRVGRRKRASLIASRTNWVNGKRRIRIDGQHALPATDGQRREVTRWLDKFAKSQPDPKFFRILDVARRVAGWEVSASTGTSCWSEEMAVTMATLSSTRSRRRLRVWPHSKGCGSQRGRASRIASSPFSNACRRSRPQCSMR